ncbi:MAG TPA: methyltransferase domain-containing protein [Chloroflexota bacterium]|nr:methyltransferase domain-containing protein [Chloroflexota bacterium]
MAYARHSSRAFRTHHALHALHAGHTSSRQGGDVPDTRQPAADWGHWELEVIPGLEPYAAHEARRRFPGRMRGLRRCGAGRLRLEYRGPPRALLQLRSVVAVHAVQTFDVPRPSALLGHQSLSRLVAFVQRIVTAGGSGMATLHLSAAGSETVVMSRMRAALARTLGLRPVQGPADLLIALHRPPERGRGWEVRVRLGARPLAARRWRVSHLPGGLDASVASVMASLADPRPGQRFLNLACGSGTLLIERLLHGPAAAAVGVDLDRAALEGARANLAAAGLARRVALLQADVSHLPFISGWADAIVADLPFGMLADTPGGTRGGTRRLYPAFIGEATRVAAPGASLVLITTAHRQLAAAVAGQGRSWRTARRIPLQLPARSRAGHIHPAIYLLRRR